MTRFRSDGCKHLKFDLDSHNQHRFDNSHHRQSLMTAAAFKACFTDWKLIRGRKCVQIVFEVPVEAADEAYHVLGGMPDPGQSVWCAIARLRDEHGKEGEADKPEHNGPDKDLPASEAASLARAHRPIGYEKRFSRQAGICCSDRLFRAFLRASLDTPRIDDATAAAVAVRRICGVHTRTAITPGSDAAAKWERLYAQFLGWRDHDMPAEKVA